MNKKFLSAILFGALMVTSTGTFVSCKDYDDDIENLQSQIDKLATKEDMTSQIASLQAALTAAQTEAAAAKTAAEEAVKKANEAASTATEAEKAAAQAALDAANAKAEAIKAAQDEVAKVKAELEKAIDTKFEAEKTKFAETITELTEKVEGLTGLTTDMVTSIDLQAGEEGEKVYSDELTLTYSQMPEAWGDKTSKKFGGDYEGAFTIHANELFTNETPFLISVAPTNAVVTGEMLSLINSKGQSLNDFVELSVAPYTGLLTRSAASTGLREVTVKLKKGADLDKFDKATLDKTNNVRYAIAATDKDGRSVTSTYDLSLTQAEKSDAACNIAEKSTIKSEIEEKAALSEYPGIRQGDVNVNDEECYPVVLGKAFQIEVGSGCGAVLASYVTVDYENSALSTTDKAALKGMTFTGVKQVSKNNKFDITINGTHAKGVVVPLKVATIDYLGNEANVVVWVKAGGNAEIAQTVSYVITPTAFVATPTAYAYANIKAFKVPAGVDFSKTKLSIVDEEDGISFTDASVLSFFEDAKGEKPSADPAKIAYAKFAATVNLQKLVDAKVYEGTVKFFDKEGTFLSQSAISIQKVLPTAFPASFTAKTNAINNGILTVYPTPGADKKGTFELNKAFNGIEGTDALNDLKFISTDAGLIGDKDNAANIDVTGTVLSSTVPYTLTGINPAIVNNGKTYTAGVAYNYGDIRSAYKVNGVVTYNHSVNWATAFSYKFGCMVVDSKYSWAAEPVVYYNEDAVVGAIVNKKPADIITVKDAYNAVMNPFVDAAEWNNYAAPINGDTKVTLKTTNEAGQVIDNEFYTAQFEKAATGTYAGAWTLKLTKKSTQVVLKGDVKTDVIITIVDKFGHEHNVPALSFTMKKSH